jgi:hypothetical protein
MAITKIGTPELFDFSSLNTALQLPTGTTADRPAAPSTGEWRYNTTLNYVEYYDGAAWRQIDTEALPNPDDFPSANFNVNTYNGTGATQTINAKFNEAANFKSTGSYITANTWGFDASTDASLTFSFWIKLHTLPSSGTNINIVQDIGSAASAFQLYIYGTATGHTISFQRVFGGNYYYNSGYNSTAALYTGFTVNTWFNIAITYASSSQDVNVYVNGSQTGVSNANYTLNTTVASGSLSTQSRFTAPNGALDQVRVFNTTLTAAQAEDLYTDETTTTAATLDFPVGAGCVAAYQLDGDASDLSGTYGGVTTIVGYTGLRFEPDFVWIKRRDGTENNYLQDSVRGSTQQVYSNLQDGQFNETTAVTSFISNGFEMGVYNGINNSTEDYVAWCWKAGGAPATDNLAAAGVTPTPGSAKIDGANATTALAGATPIKRFSLNTQAGFSITTFEAPSASSSTIPHGLGVTPGLIIAKRTDTTGNWAIQAPVLGPGYLLLNSSNGYDSSDTSIWNNTAATSTEITIATGAGTFFPTGGEFVVYCFANIDGYQRIGTYTGTGSDTGNYIYTDSNGDGTGTGGFEPAFLLVKRTSSGGSDWFLYDNKRMYGSEAPANPLTGELRPNTSNGEDDYPGFNFYSNGFEVANSGTNMNQSGQTFIYLAIAANKDTSVPSATNSFSPTLYTGTGSSLNVFTPNKPNFTWIKGTDTVDFHSLFDNLRGAYATGGGVLSSDAQSAQAVFNGFTLNPNGFTVPTSGQVNGSSDNYVSWNWTAGGPGTLNKDGTTPSVVSVNAAAGFSIVKYVGPVSSATIGHGLGKTPSMIIQKQYTATSDWYVYFPPGVIDATSNYYYMELNDTAGTLTTGSTPPDATTFNSAATGPIIAYCFADISGYQKVGSYDGNGSSTGPVVDCGFTPSFVMIKAITTDNGGGAWIIYDSARSPSNPRDKRLYANTNQQEQQIAQYDLDFLTGTPKGFQPKDGSNYYGYNTLGVTYTFLAIK